jgi:hypothetical protein
MAPRPRPAVSSTLDNFTSRLACVRARTWAIANAVFALTGKRARELRLSRAFEV